jgi:hypothetical protein
LTVEEIAQEAGVSKIRVQFRLKLLDLRADLQKLVRQGQLALGYAQIISDGHLDRNRQLIALSRLRDNPNPTPAWLRNIVSELKTEQDQEELFDLDSLTVQEIENREAQEIEQPALPSTTTPPTTGSSTDEIIQNQITFWQEAAQEWDHLGKSFKRQECQAAIDALDHVLASIG